MPCSGLSIYELDSPLRGKTTFQHSICYKQVGADQKVTNAFGQPFLLGDDPWFRYPV